MASQFDKTVSRLLREAYTGTEPDRQLITEWFFLLPWAARAAPYLLRFGGTVAAWVTADKIIDSMVPPEQMQPPPPDFDLAKTLEEFDWSNVLVPAGVVGAALGGNALINAVKKGKKADAVRKKAPDKYRVEASESSFADAKKGDIFLFDEVGAFVEDRGVNIRSAQDVIDYLSQFGQWELGDSKLGGVLIKTA